MRIASATYFCGLRNCFAEKLDLEVAMSGVELPYSQYLVDKKDAPSDKELTVTDMIWGSLEWKCRAVVVLADARK